MSTDIKERAENLDAYREHVKRASEVAGNAEGELFLNRSKQHAAVIVEFLFRKATKSMEILTGMFDPVVFANEQVIAAAIAYLRREDGGISILTETALDTQTHLFFLSLRNEGLLGRVDLREVPVSLQKEYEYHFAVADEVHFRFEQSRAVPEAVVQFNGKLGAKLHSIFSGIRDHSLSVPLA